MFEMVAHFVTRRYKLIVIVWVLAVLVALPFAPQVFNVLQYEETQMAPSNIESEVAQEYIGEHFGNISDQSTTIIVLSGNDVLNNETRSVVYEIDDGLFDASHSGAIDAIVSVDSLYSSGKLYLAGFLRGISANYPSLVERTNLTAYSIFGLPLQFQSLYNDTNQTAFMIYGIPGLYNQTWEGIYRGAGAGEVAISDNLTYAMVKGLLPSMAAGLDQSMQQMYNGWYFAFTQAWNATSSVPSISTNPIQRAQIAVANAFEPFLERISIIPKEMAFLELVNSSFTITTYNDFHAISRSSQAQMAQNLDSILKNTSQDQKDLIRGYFGAFYTLWNSSSSVPSGLALRAMVEAATSNFAASLPVDQGRFLQSIYALGWSGWNNSAAINVLAINALAAMSHAEPWIINQVVALGPNASLGEIVGLAIHIMDTSSITSFPIPLPQELINGYVSPDNTTMIISLTYTSTSGGSTEGKAYVDQVRQVVQDSVQGTGIVPYVTGSDPVSNDMEGSLNNDLHLIEPVTIILILVLIGLYFRSFVASSVPPLLIGLALGIAFALVFFIGSYLLSIHYSVVTLMLTSMMGAGCDYCIFILSRYREERRNGREMEGAVHTAVTWAGESIATSGATVIIGFGVLSLGRFSMLQSMGISLALGVTIALLAALTLLPAALMIAGDKVYWPAKLNTRGHLKNKGVGYFTHSAKFAIRHAKVILIVAILISIPTTYLVFTLDTSYDFIGALPDTESKIGLEVMAADFGGSKIMPTYVALTMTGPVVFGAGSFSNSELNSIENLCSRIASLPNVKQVISPTRPLGEPINYSNLAVYSAEEEAQLEATMLSMIGNDQRSVLIKVVLVDEPFAKPSIDSISTLRQISKEVPQADSSIMALYVGGSTASMKDISDMVGGDFSTIELAVVIGIYVVLLVVLGSVINPLRSILTILLSISWTLALTMLVFQFYLSQPILWMLPMVLLVVCLGLGMDYDILLTTRIREEASKGMSNNDAIVHAVERTGGIITACGIIMAAAFGSMILSQGALLKEFGFALMFAILLDATIVRIYLVPAIMSLLGEWNWWAPGPLRRRNRLRLNEFEEISRLIDPDASFKK